MMEGKKGIAMKWLVSILAIVLLGVLFLYLINKKLNLLRP